MDDKYQSLFHSFASPLLLRSVQYTGKPLKPAVLSFPLCLPLRSVRKHDKRRPPPEWAKRKIRMSRVASCHPVAMTMRSSPTIACASNLMTHSDQYVPWLLAMRTPAAVCHPAESSPPSLWAMGPTTFPARSLPSAFHC